jgi:hypothetical protein
MRELLRWNMRLALSRNPRSAPDSGRLLSRPVLRLFCAVRITASGATLLGVWHVPAQYALT